MSLNLSDQSSNSNDLTNNGATENTSSSPFAASTSVASLVAASSQYLTALNSSSLNITSNITLEAWVKITAFGSDNLTIMCKGRADGDVNTRYNIRVGSDGRVHFSYASSGPTFHEWHTTDPQVSSGTWTHLAITFTYGTGSSIKCYINGSSVGGSWVGGDGNSAVLAETDVLQIGRIHSVSGTPSEFFDGLLDELRIWNTIRTATEISNNKSVELTGTESGLVAYYPFEAIPSPSISPSASVSPSSSASSSPSASVSPSASLSPSSSLSISPSASLSPSSSSSSSISASVSPSASISPSISPSPSLGYTLYSRESSVTLPSNDQDLTHIYTDQEVIATEEEGDQLVGQTGQMAYMIHQFRNFVGLNTVATVEWVGQTTLAPEISAVYLQIYNYTTHLWETIDSNTISDEDRTFVLTKTLRDLTNYVQNSLITCRVYQLAI